MTPDEIRDRFNSITVWKRGGERAPHKPLLALYAIGRVLRGEPRLAAYADSGTELSDYKSSDKRPEEFDESLRNAMVPRC